MAFTILLIISGKKKRNMNSYVKVGPSFNGVFFIKTVKEVGKNGEVIYSKNVPKVKINPGNDYRLVCILNVITGGVNKILDISKETNGQLKLKKLTTILQQFLREDFKLPGGKIVIDNALCPHKTISITNNPSKKGDQHIVYLIDYLS